MKQNLCNVYKHDVYEVTNLIERLRIYWTRITEEHNSIEQVIDSNVHKLYEEFTFEWLIIGKTNILIYKTIKSVLFEFYYICYLLHLSFITFVKKRL